MGIITFRDTCWMSSFLPPVKPQSVTIAVSGLSLMPWSPFHICLGQDLQAASCRCSIRHAPQAVWFMFSSTVSALPCGACLGRAQVHRQALSPTVFTRGWHRRRSNTLSDSIPPFAGKSPHQSSLAGKDWTLHTLVHLLFLRCLQIGDVETAILVCDEYFLQQSDWGHKFPASATCYTALYYRAGHKTILWSHVITKDWVKATWGGSCETKTELAL